MNHIKNLRFFKNTYILIRHAESLSNVKGVINSNPTTGLKTHPLTKHGRIQSKRFAKKIYSTFKNKDVVIIASEFIRTQETAKPLADKLSITINIDKRLNERFFGDLDKGSSDLYKLVWLNYDVDDVVNYFNVENKYVLMDRVSSLVFELEHNHNNKVIILFSHGDTLKYLELCFAKGGEFFNTLPTILRNCEHRIINKK